MRANAVSVVCASLAQPKPNESRSEVLVYAAPNFPRDLPLAEEQEIMGVFVPLGRTGYRRIENSNHVFTGRYAVEMGSDVNVVRALEEIDGREWETDIGASYTIFVRSKWIKRAPALTAS